VKLFQIFAHFKIYKKILIFSANPLVEKKFSKLFTEQSNFVVVRGDGVLAIHVLDIPFYVHIHVNCLATFQC
jgi:hypothetical protein